MPRPDLRIENLSNLVQEAVFLERNRIAGIDFEVVLPGEAIRLRCDSRQISQALTNILKNAAEAIVGRVGEAEEALPPGKVKVVVRQEGTDGEAKRIVVAVEDNGKGLPDEDRDRLTEPYVTTRTKGTGLGLAIVKKIMEDHNADLVLEDGDDGGARVTLIFYPMDQSVGVGQAMDGEESAESDVNPMKFATDMRANG
jgi:two-component system nitrogen regulation sensor histidine kinase NtrY